MTTKHTPGPWRWQTTETTSHYGYIIDEGEFQPICNIMWRNSEANARLIIAAPDLLAALITLIEQAQFCCVPQDDPKMQAVINTARAAVAKAEVKNE